jgi:hypothetical protein
MFQFVWCVLFVLKKVEKKSKECNSIEIHFKVSEWFIGHVDPVFVCCYRVGVSWIGSM